MKGLILSALIHIILWQRYKYKYQIMKLISQGKIVYTGTDSITLQLRANGSVSVNLFSRQGNFSMESITSLEDTT